MKTEIRVRTHLLGNVRVGRIVGTKVIGNDETVNEAIEAGHVIGKKGLVSKQVRGVLKSMIDGVGRDGCGRKIDGYISIQPVVSGRLEDICDEFDWSKMSVRAIAQVLNDAQVDTSNWSIVIEGDTEGVIVDSITTGEETDVIVVGEDLIVTGSGLALGSTDTVTWAVIGTEKTGTVAAAKMTSEPTLITIAGDVLSELASAEYDGKTILFTFNIGGKTAQKTATLSVND